MNPSYTESPSGPSNSFTIANAGPVNQSDTSQQDSAGMDTEQDKMFDFSQARIHLSRIIEDWHTEIEDTEVRRKTRDIEIDTEGLRQKGDLEEDETIIPVRVIDQNITREQPAVVNYLINSRRLCIFRSLSNPNQDAQEIEHEFSLGMTYTGWISDHFKCYDGAQTHGWAAIEVSYDTTKPLNCGIDYIEHDSLLWPRSIKNIQDAPRVIRCYDVTVTKLKEWIRSFDFSAEQVDLLIQSRKDNQKENETVRIYKLYFKKENIVYVSWFATTDGVSDWLKAPQKLFVGIKHKVQKQTMVQTPVPLPTGETIITQIPQMQESWEESDVELYPVFILPYRESEKPKLVDRKGRVYLDESKQEAQTAILSGFVNGLTRASNVYASPKQDDGSGSSLKELEDVKLVCGRVFNKPLEFWQIPYPDAMILRAMQYFDVANSQEANQISFSAMNREDSRKTATEMKTATQQQSMLNGVQLTLFSTHIRAVYSFAWLIVQSQALQGAIDFLQIVNPALQQSRNGMPPNPNTQQFVNDDATISQRWELRAAGDVDVVERNEIEQKMQQDFAIIQNTPLQPVFMQDYVRLRYGDKGESYAKMLEQQPIMDQLKGLVLRLTTVLQGVFKDAPQLVQQLQPQERADVSQLIQEGMSVAQQKPNQ